jgi:phenylacetate-coenzyme A ligase PaaK-like adenylate-forming protein
MRFIFQRLRIFLYSRAFEKYTHSLPSVFFTSDRPTKTGAEFKLYVQLLQNYIALSKRVRTHDFEFVNKLQRYRLHKTLKVAETTVWWKAYFSTHTFNPHTKGWFQQFKLLPPVDRTTFLDAPVQSLLTVDKNKPYVWWRNTSGSTTGTPFSWAIDMRVSVINAFAGSVERLKEYGFPFEEKVRKDFLFQFNITQKIHTIYNVSSGELELSKKAGSESDAQIAMLMQRIDGLGNSVIYSTPSNALLLTKEMEKRGLHPHVKFFLLTGEPVDKRLHEYIEGYFGCRMITLYGAQELALIGTECADHTGSYHILERAYVELLDSNGSDVTAGDEGIVTITLLDNNIMPLIRYQPGDVGKIHFDTVCSCSINTPRLEVLARTKDVIHLTKTETSSALWLFQLFGKEPFFSLIRRYRIIETDFGKVTVLVESKNTLTKDDIRSLQDSVRFAYRNRLEATVQQVQEIPHEGSKFQVFIPMPDTTAAKEE